MKSIAIEYKVTIPPLEGAKFPEIGSFSQLEFPTKWTDIYALTKEHPAGVEVATRCLGDERDWSEIPSEIVTLEDFEKMS